MSSRNRQRPDIPNRSPDGGAGGGGSSPVMSGMSVWYDASQPQYYNATAGAVDQANDRSGNNNNATSATTLRPTALTRTQNSLNVFDFNGTNRLTIPVSVYPVAAGDNTIMGVWATDLTSPSVQRLVGGKSGGGSTTFGNLIRPASALVDYVSSNTAVAAQNTAAANTNPHIIGGVRSGANETVIYDGLLNVATSASNTTLSELGIGWDSIQTASQGLDGFLAELIIYNRALTDAEINQTGRYLANKWLVPWYLYPMQWSDGTFMQWADNTVIEWSN